ncbi:hypothetical protein BT69DRAFT_1280879 [Atractiella rhizophila]|nr:hypothetical protein BT69DRAFT_1280879 [Atractiella rhizophila]
MAARYNTDDIVVRFVLFRSFNGPSRLGSTVSIPFSVHHSSGNKHLSRTT